MAIQKLLKVITIKIEDYVVDLIDKYAKEANMTRSELVRRFIYDGLQRVIIYGLEGRMKGVPVKNGKVKIRKVSLVDNTGSSRKSANLILNLHRLRYGSKYRSRREVAKVIGVLRDRGYTWREISYITGLSKSTVLNYYYGLRAGKI